MSDRDPEYERLLYAALNEELLNVDNVWRKGHGLEPLTELPPERRAAVARELLVEQAQELHIGYDKDA